MKKSGVVITILIMFLILFVNTSVLADYEKGNVTSSIVKTYGPGENLKGWINISLDDEPGDSELTAFDSEIELLDFLRINDADYTCTPSGCESDYEPSDGEATKKFNLGYSGEKSKIVGVEMTGELGDIISFSMKVASNYTQNTLRPSLKIDILNNDEIEWQSNVGSGEYKNKDYGCYNPAISSQTDITIAEFCEKIIISATPSIRIGADVVEKTGGNVDFFMTIEGDDYSEECIASASGTGSISCDINKPIEEKGNFSVCIKTKQAGDAGNYTLGYEDVNPCGYTGSYKHDFAVYAQESTYAPAGSFVLDNNAVEGNLENYIEEDIYRRYEDDCTDGCIIPIKFMSDYPQEITISEVSVRYEAGGLTHTEDKVHDLEEEAPRIDMDFQKLFLDEANLSVPESYGNKTLYLELNDERIIRQSIQVLRVPIIENVVPRNAPAAVSTEFEAIVTGEKITSYVWDFGDGTTETTTTNTTHHAYPSLGNYTLTLEVQNNLGKSSKSFTIYSVSPEDYVKSTIAEYKTRLAYIDSQTSLFPSWYKDIARAKIGVDSMIEKIDNLDINMGEAEDDEDYVEIMSGLATMRVPYDVGIGGEGSLPYFVDVDLIEPSYFEEMTAGNIVNVQKYKEAISRWDAENVEITLDFEYIVGFYDEGIEDIAVAYELKMQPYKAVNQEVYILIEDTNLEFDKTYTTKSFADATGITLPNLRETQNIRFVSETGIEEIMVYISPKFSLLEIEEIGACNFNGVCETGLGEDWKNCRADCKPWGWASIMIIIVLFCGIIAYILMQWWYKIKYEKYLFKDRRDVYNLYYFVKNARTQGLSDAEIMKRLREKGWKREQVNYIFKKMKGEAIKAFDFVKLFKKRGVQKAVEAREGISLEGYTPGRAAA